MRKVLYKIRQRLAEYWLYAYNLLLFPSGYRYITASHSAPIKVLDISGKDISGIVTAGYFSRQQMYWRECLVWKVLTDNGSILANPVTGKAFVYKEKEFCAWEKRNP